MRASIGARAVTSRPLDPYRDMFLLDEDDLTAGPILDCPAGASPFGAQVRELGGGGRQRRPANGDPDGLVATAHADLERIVAWQRSHPDGINWSYLRSPDRVRRWLGAAIGEFERDFAVDGERYVAASLPALPFPDDRFALAVSGFLLFVYPELFDLDDHRDALLELVRVTRGEVRVFPLHHSAGAPYPTSDSCGRRCVTGESAPSCAPPAARTRPTPATTCWSAGGTDELPAGAGGGAAPDGRDTAAGGWLLVEDFDVALQPLARPSPRGADEEPGARLEAANTMQVRAGLGTATGMIAAWDRTGSRTQCCTRSTPSRSPTRTATGSATSGA